MEQEAAELRSFEPDHHEYPRARRERVIVVQQSTIQGRDESPVTEALDCRRPRARGAEIGVDDHELRLMNLEVVALIPVVHEQPMLPDPIPTGQVRQPINLNRPVNLPTSPAPP